MNIWTALLPLLGLLAGGGVIAALLAFRSKHYKPKEKELPTDPLTNLFIDKEEQP